MNIVTFETFDPAPYQRVPIVNLRSTVVLAKALADGVPLEPTAQVLKRRDRMQTWVAKAEDELTARLRAEVAAVYGVPIELDGGADVLWSMCVRRLELYAGYEHVGFTTLINNPELALGASLAQERKTAERARELHKRLFGDRGLSFLRGTFREQSEATGAILRLIEQDKLGEELGEFVGVALVEQLFAIQELYETMVLDQLKAEPSALVSLRDLRLRLARLIGQYNNSVLDMLDEDAPETLEVVVTALRPMVRLRELLAEAARKGGEASVVVNAELEDLVGEEGAGSDVGEQE